MLCVLRKNPESVVIDGSFVTFLLVSGITYIVETMLVWKYYFNFRTALLYLHTSNSASAHPSDDVFMGYNYACSNALRYPNKFNPYLVSLLSLRCIRLKKRVLQICHSARPINMYELILLDWKETCRRFSFGRNRVEVKRTGWKV